MNASFLAIDLGGTSIKLALANRSGELLDHNAIPTESQQGPEDVIRRMIAEGERLLAKAETEQLSGIGVGVPGLVDQATGITRFLPNLHTQWRGIELGPKLASHFQAPVKLLNDARAATLGELKYGHGQSLPKATLAFFTIGTGVGGGIAVDGKLRLGPLGAAGELGHQTIDPHGPICGCGNRGCLESLASASAIIAEGARLMKSDQAPALQELVGNDLNQLSVAAMASVMETDAAIELALQRAFAAIGIGAANLVTALHPDLIVLGGGVAEIGKPLLDAVSETIRQRVGMFPTESIRVEKSLLGERAGIFGAIRLAIEASQQLE